MTDEQIRKAVHAAVDAYARDTAPDPWLAQRVVARAASEGEIKVKKKLSTGLIVALILILLTVTALAATAFDDLKRVWEDSFKRMNTSGWFDAVDREEVEQYRDIEKEDMVVSTVPDENNLPYEAALAIARQAIFDAFGTPAAELDAMGSYPRYIESVHDFAPNEWEFYFTPLTGVDIDEDHAYPGPGEYRVYVESPSGEVTYCGWYIDDFWPDYARRTWEAGKQEYVFEQAHFTAFRTMSQADQDAFRALFTQAGFDVSELEYTKEELLHSLELKIEFTQEESLLHSDDPALRAAVQAMQDVYGLSEDLMDTLCFIARPSPLASDTVDYIFAYGYETEWARAYGIAERMAITYADRLGMYMIQLDPATLAVVDTVHSLRTPAYEKAEDPDHVLGRRDWSAADMPEFLALLQEAHALDARQASGEITMDDCYAEVNALMRRYGGDKDLYSRRTLAEAGTSKEALVGRAFAAVAEKTGESEDALRAHCPDHRLQYDGLGHYTVYLLTTEDTWTDPDTDTGWYVYLDDEAHTVTVERLEGNG